MSQLGDSAVQVQIKRNKMQRKTEHIEIWRKYQVFWEIVSDMWCITIFIRGNSKQAGPRRPERSGGIIT